jgi:hypothetical protein
MRARSQERAAGRAAEADGVPAPATSGVGLAAAVFIVVVLIGYSDTIIFGASDLARAPAPSWTLPLVDVCLLNLLAVLVWRPHAMATLGKERRLVATGIAGAALLLTIDSLYVWAPEVADPLAVDLLLQFGWVIALALLLAAGLGADPRALLGAPPAPARTAAWRRFRFALRSSSGRWPDTSPRSSGTASCSPCAVPRTAG